jgi:hypothetical protein
MSPPGNQHKPVPSRLVLIELPPMTGREVWLLVNFLSQAVRALRHAYPRAIIDFLKHADHLELVPNPDDLFIDLEIDDETGASTDIPF